MSFGSFEGMKNSKLPYFIGCREYGRSPQASTGRYGQVPASTDLQSAKSQIFQAMVNDASEGFLPENNTTNASCRIVPVF